FTWNNFIPHLPESTGTSTFPLIADGLQTSDVLPSLQEQEQLPITDGLQTFEVLVLAGAPNILCSVDASTISSGRHTHMIAELSSRDGKKNFSFIAGCNFFVCAVYLREGRSDGRPEQIYSADLKISKPVFWNSFSFPITEGLNSSATEGQTFPRLGDRWTHKFWGASSDFPALPKRQ
ncbi:hypothetical protein TNCV_4777521, partial [Trichonephila clavipes]